ncbi:hypothetical protein HMPREF1529_01488 [Microbacterium sp. oral taxon 186 str. F0373]|uniref:phosphotransferase family protein n=1 Tax=Microbacterium sp. oral taxon 186 TaxID=712383 RepID=UPI00034E5188|nr:phosphotransferase [Microbacterium sp. oral taxon 186]EPD84882.1 hypothetical protein HMPREF1529_01488 [Microbacterium sp. oral taxon 186 str. F0373]
MYTGFVAPADDVVDDVVARALGAAGERVPRRDWQRVEHGSANLVVLAGRVAVRVARTADAASEALRAQRLIDALPPLPFAVPRSAAPAIDDRAAGGVVAIAQERVDGEPHPSGSGDAVALRRLLDALRETDLTSLRTNLAHRHTFFGGGEGLRLMTGDAVAMLAPTAREGARRVADAFVGLAPHGDVLTHGDLAGSNVLWTDGVASTVSGLIDWDLAAADDEAKDVAALATWHGWDLVAQIVPPEVTHRARVTAATYPLQLLCFAIAGGRPATEIERALTRANDTYAS